MSELDAIASRPTQIDVNGGERVEVAIDLRYRSALSGPHGPIYQDAYSNHPDAVYACL